MKTNQTFFCNPLAYLFAVIILIPVQAWFCLNLLLEQQRAWADMLSTYIRTAKLVPNFQAGDPHLLAATMFIDCMLLAKAIWLIKNGCAKSEAGTAAASAENPAA